VWVAFSKVLFPFLPWHRLLKPFSFLLSPAIYPHHGAPETKVQFSPKTDYKALYTWAPDDLLNECTTLTTF